MKRKLLLPIGLAMLLCSCGGTNPSSTISSKPTESSVTSSVISSSAIPSISTPSSSEISSLLSSSTEISSSEEISSVIPSTGFNVTFVVDEHVTLTVYTTKEYDVVDTDTNIQTRNGETGEYCNDGDNSQVNFKLTVEDGYEIESITGTSGTYKQVKWPTDTLVENGYRVTKVTGDTTITITAKSKQADPEGYKVSFVLEHCTLQVHIGKDTTTTDEPDLGGNYYTRDKDTLEFTKNNSTAQINFTVFPEEGYEFISGAEPSGELPCAEVTFIEGKFKNLKNGGNNFYTVTKVETNLVITLTCTLIEK